MIIIIVLIIITIIYKLNLYMNHNAYTNKVKYIILEHMKTRSTPLLIRVVLRNQLVEIRVD